MNDMQAQVSQFNKACGVVQSETPFVPNTKVCELRTGLIEEELIELKEAIEKRDVVSCADALADLLYVVFGCADVMGINMKPVFDEVHRSNMTKCVGGHVVVRADGKVMKPATYEPPQIASVLFGTAKS